MTRPHLFLFFLLAVVLPAQGPWTLNSPEIGARLDGIQTQPGDANHALSVRYLVPLPLPTGAISTHYEVQTGLPLALHEVLIHPGTPLPAGDPRVLTLGPGQTLHFDVLNGPLPGFLYGGLAQPSFQPLAGSLVLPATIDQPLELSLQAVILDPTTPSGARLSQVSQLSVQPSPLGRELPGPTQDEEIVTVPLAQLALENPGMPPVMNLPGIGPIDRLHVSSNGRVLLGGPAPAPNSQPSPQAARQGSPFFGLWVDLDPSAGGSIRIIPDGDRIVRVAYEDVPYAGETATATFALEIDLVDGTMLMRDLLGVQPSNQITGGGRRFLGYSSGAPGAQDPGPRDFSTDSLGQTLLPEEMIFDFHDPLLAPGGQLVSLAGGVSTLVLLPADPGSPHALEWIASFGPPMPDPDPNHLEELRAYAREAWRSHDLGFPSPGSRTFQWSHRAALGPDFDPFGEADAIFIDVYGHRLGERGDVLDDLLQGNDPILLQAFRHYTETGRLRTSVSDDPVAHANHLAATREALLSGSMYHLGAVLDLGAGFLETFDLVREGKDPKKADRAPVPANPANLPAAKQLIHAQLVAQRNHLTQRTANNPGGVTYVDDGAWSWSKPGFDCDDFADSMCNHIARVVPGTTVSTVRVGWKEPGWTTAWQYHRVARIESGGCYWLMDAQSGGIIGPFAVGTPMNASALVRGPYQVGANAQLWTGQTTRAVGVRGSLREPAPWWTDADRRRQMTNERGNWRNYAPPGYQP